MAALEERLYHEMKARSPSPQRQSKRDDDADRPLVVRAFACQEAIDWPELDALIESDLAA